MFKSYALAAFLFFSNAEAIKINSRSLARNEFVKKMRGSQKKHGKISRQLSFDTFIAKSVHKPGLRTKTEERRSEPDTETEAGRKLYWWQSGGTEDGAVNMTRNLEMVTTTVTMPTQTETICGATRKARNTLWRVSETSL
jgi:hypothetical protein